MTLAGDDMKEARLIIALVLLCASFGCVTARPGNGQSPATQDSRNRQDVLMTQRAEIDKAIIRWTEQQLPAYEAARNAQPHIGMETSYIKALFDRRKNIQQELEAIGAHDNNSANKTSEPSVTPAPQVQR